MRYRDRRKAPADSCRGFVVTMCQGWDLQSVTGLFSIDLMELRFKVTASRDVVTWYSRIILYAHVARHVSCSFLGASQVMEVPYARACPCLSSMMDDVAWFQGRLVGCRLRG